MCIRDRNYLIGKDDIYQETLILFNKQPDLIKAIPSLLACREKIIDLLLIDENRKLNFEKLDFININEDNIETYVNFMEKTGLLSFLQNQANRSLVDYVYGVEAGVDSNARKNRSGTTMEKIISEYVNDVSTQLGLEHCSQATAEFVYSNWKVEIPVDKSKRRFDEAIYNPLSNHVWLIETNYYGGGGSKLKSVSGEFITLNEFISTSKDNVTFVWITDGKGWNTAKLPLLEAFGVIDNIFNLKMLEDGFLYDLFKE